MVTKDLSLWFHDCYARIELTSDGDQLTMTVSELDTDEEQSSKGHEVLKTTRVSEVFLGIEEARELIRALESVLPVEDKQ